jgi:nucleotide-binding universal stress UspA family protein
VSTKVLVPLDGSELAEVAVGYAEQLAKTLGWGVVLFSVVHSDSEHHLFVPATPVIEAPPEVWERWAGQLGADEEELRHEMAAAVDSMAAAAERLQAAGLQVEREVGVGNVRDVIVKRAADDDIAMIVMASHGRTGLARLVRGSVASGVVDHSNRAVLVVRPFRDPEHRLDLEHADRLPPEQAEAVRRAIGASAG